MFKKFLVSAFSLALLSTAPYISVGEAFKCYVSSPSAHISCNTWNAVVSQNTIYIPNINVELKSFEGETYRLDVKWENFSKEIKRLEYGPYYDKKGRLKRGNHYEIHVVPNWIVTEVRKNGQLTNSQDTRLLKELLKELAGIDEGYRYDFSPYGHGYKEYYTFGAKEVFDEVTKTYTHYDGYSNPVYTNDHVTKLLAFPIYSRLNGFIVAQEYSYISGDYFPAINESVDNSSLYSATYKYMKNSSGVWRKCQANHNSLDHGWNNSWYNVSEDLIPKLEQLKAALGI